jgi:hypothetical protein
MRVDAIGIATTVAARRCGGEIVRMDRPGTDFGTEKKLRDDALIS